MLRTSLLQELKRAREFDDLSRKEKKREIKEEIEG